MSGQPFRGHLDIVCTNSVQDKHLKNNNINVVLDVIHVAGADISAVFTNIATAAALFSGHSSSYIVIESLC